MKKTTLLFFFLLLLLFSRITLAQSGYVTVTANIPTYAGGQATASFVNQSSAPQLPLLNGSVFATTAVGNMDANGKFSLTLADNLVIQPTPSQWQIIICSKTGNPTQPCYPVQLTITCVGNPSCSNGTLDVSASFVNAPTPFNPATNNLFTNVFSSRPGDTVQSIEQMCSSLCSYIVTTPQTITLSSNHTLSSNVNLVFAVSGSWTVNGSGFKLTIPTEVNGPPTTHFLGSAAIQLGQKQDNAPVEWFGAVGDWNGTTGTDNTGAIQDCIDALTAGQCVLQAKTYLISSALSFTRSNIGLRGQTRSVRSPTLYPAPIGSILISNSTSLNLINVAGTSISNNIFFNHFNDFTLQRSVIATGAARGMQFDFTYGALVEGVVVEDSPGGFFIHASGSQGSGGFYNDVAAWGYAGFTQTSGSFCGFCLDSSDGNPNPSLRIEGSAVFSNLGAGVTTIGLQSIGTALEDSHVRKFETAGVSFGEFISAASGISSALDIHFWETVNDGCKVSCIFVQATKQAPTSIEFNGGWNFQTTSTTPVIDLESASNVTISNMDIFFPSTGPAVMDNIGSGNTIIGNQFLGNPHSSAVKSIAASKLIIASNQMWNITAPLALDIQSTTNGVVSGNVIGGTGTSAIRLDANTHGIAGIETNTLNGTYSGQAIVDLGVNPTTLPLFYQLGNNGSVYQIRQKIRVTGTICTAAANNGCTFTLTWPNPFPDANWSGACVNEASSGPGVTWTVNSAGKTTTTASVQYFNLTASSNTLTAAVCEGWE